jgi:putative glutathione S-transferase
VSKPSYGNTWDKQVSEDGEFVRKETTFRARCSASPGAEHPAEAGRYHLYVSYACPWAHRTLITRALKGLEDTISVDVVHPILPDTGWSFDADVDGATGDRVNGFARLRDAYDASDPDYAGAVTVPVLWDKQAGRIVNNESAEIIRFLNSEFQAFAKHPDLDLYPETKRAEIDELNDWIYPTINNGVYRCGFAKTQSAYSRAFEELFAALDRVEAILAKQRFLTGSEITEADVRLFTTLVRFDAVYLTHFKTNLHRLIEYPAMWSFVRDVYQLPGVAGTTEMTHIKRHYFESHRGINPLGIVPDGPEIDLLASHERDRL